MLLEDYDGFEYSISEELADEFINESKKIERCSYKTVDKLCDDFFNKRCKYRLEGQITGS